MRDFGLAQRPEFRDRPESIGCLNLLSAGKVGRVSIHVAGTDLRANRRTAAATCFHSALSSTRCSSASALEGKSQHSVAWAIIEKECL